jgi:tRNA (guanine-N7-)-methyltransferase
MSDDSTEPKILRRLRSYVRREGRMTDGQKAALERLWPRYGIESPTQAFDPEALFGRRAPLVFEIGFGNGDHLLARAMAEPERDFIGAEVHRPGVGRLLIRAEQAGLNNLRVVCHDAVECLEQGLPDAALAEAVVYFPDPWHKKKHNKRRIIQAPFVALLARKLAPGGLLRLATDWAPYAEHMLATVSANPQLRNLSPDGAYAPRPESRPKTRFEARGERLGHEVFDLLFERLPG